jgi:glucan phosphoethanolaminetransferase (alkaline phosphatase superfamily)
MMQSKNIPAWQISIIIIAVLIVLAHIIVSGLHGIAHTQNEVSLSDLQYVYVFLVTLVMPVAAALTLFFNRSKKILKVGAWLLVVSMLGSLLFGITYHMVLPSSDNIFVVMHGPSLDSAILFTSTATLLVIIDGLGSWIGAILICRMPKVMP